MQQFTIPQFIDVEDKILGPITTRQFLILLAAFMIIALLYKLLYFTYFVISALSILAVAGVFAFFRINGMPFHFFILNFMQTSKSPKIRIWNNKYGKEQYEDFLEKKLEPKKIQTNIKTFSSSRLNELSLMVDTQGQYKGERKIDESEVRVKEEMEIV